MYIERKPRWKTTIIICPFARILPICSRHFVFLIVFPLHFAYFFFVSPKSLFHPSLALFTPLLYKRYAGALLLQHQLLPLSFLSHLFFLSRHSPVLSLYIRKSLIYTSKKEKRSLSKIFKSSPWFNLSFGSSMMIATNTPASGPSRIVSHQYHYVSTFIIYIYIFSVCLSLFSPAIFLRLWLTFFLHTIYTALWVLSSSIHLAIYFIFFLSPIFSCHTEYFLRSV